MAARLEGRVPIVKARAARSLSSDDASDGTAAALVIERGQRASLGAPALEEAWSAS
jgi:hypothetical protein